MQFLQRDKHAPLPLLPQKNVNLGSFPKKDPGYEVEWNYTCNLALNAI
jgi:hypothetical protein